MLSNLRCSPKLYPPEEDTKNQNLTTLPTEEIKTMQKRLGALLYLCNVSRPDLGYALQKIATNMAHPTIHDSECLLQVFRYLKHTKSNCLHYSKHNYEILDLYSDADFGNDKITYRSVSGSVHRVFGNPISWSSKKQAWVALSTAESEMNALVETVRDISWIRLLLIEIHQCKPEFIPVINVDNKAAIFISESYKTNRNVRHVGVRISFLRERLNKIFVLKYVNSSSNIADALTKSLPASSLLRFRESIFLKPQKITHCGGVL